MERLETGLTNISSELETVAEGSVVCFLGSPAYMVDELMLHILKTDRHTSYLSLNKPDLTIERIAQSIVGDIDHLRVYEADGGVKDETATIMSRIDDKNNYIIDSLSKAAEGMNEKEYRIFLHELYTQTISNNGVTYLYIPKTSVEDLNQKETEAMDLADYVVHVVDERGNDVFPYACEILKHRF